MKAVLLAVVLMIPVLFVGPETEHWRHDPSITGHMISGVFTRDGRSVRVETECRPIYQTTKRVFRSEDSGDVVHYHINCLKL